MKKRVLLPVLPAILIAAMVSFVPTAAQAQRSKPIGKSANESYIVIKIGEEYKVITARSFSDEQKQLADKYKDDVKKWQDDIKTDPKTPKPIKQNALKMPKIFKTQEGANKYKDQLVADQEAKNAKKKDKK